MPNRPNLVQQIKKSKEMEGIIQDERNVVQGGDAAAGSVLCWHPYFPVLAVATNAAIVEYDAVSGCRRNMVDCDGAPVKLQYSFDGSYIVLLTRVRSFLVIILFTLLMLCRLIGAHGYCASINVSTHSLFMFWICRKETYLHGRRKHGKKRHCS